MYTHTMQNLSFSNMVKILGPSRSAKTTDHFLQCHSKGNVSVGGARERRRREPLGGSENFEIQSLGNAISSVLQELFVIYAYRKLFTS
mgnify:CR=1 FL=1